MDRGSTVARRLLVAAALLLAAVPYNAVATPTGAWGWHLASRGIAIIAGRSGNLATGFMVLDGTPLTLSCLDVVTGERGSQTIYTRWALVNGTPGAPGVWSKVDGLAVEHEVVEQATAGFSRASTSEDHCGAAGVQDSLTAARFSLAVDG